jgi:hypothetical protein
VLSRSRRASYLAWQPRGAVMNSRSRLLMPSLPVLIAIVVAYYFLVSDSPRISQASCAAIRPGMHKAEVEAALHAPPGNYATRPLIPRAVPHIWIDADWWCCDNGAICVRYDLDDKVLDARFYNLEEDPNPKWRDWLYLIRTRGPLRARK